MVNYDIYRIASKIIKLFPRIFWNIDYTDPWNFPEFNYDYNTRESEEKGMAEHSTVIWMKFSSILLYLAGK